MKLAGKTDVGRVRQENQDDYRAGELPGGAVWALVCDGMGGAKGGREASQGACNVIEQVFQEQYAQCGAGQEGAFLKKALISANRYVFNKAAHEESLAGMGTTAVCALVRGGTVYLCHAGDSRAYLFRAGKLTQLTHDHSYVQELVDCGTITVEEAEHHPQKNIITKALGVDYRLEPEFTSEKLQKGDVLLLCTDGLTGKLSDSQLQAALGADLPLPELGQALMAQALAAGPGDNITLVLIEITALDAETAVPLPQPPAEELSQTRRFEVPAARIAEQETQRKKHALARRREIILTVAVVLAVLAAVIAALWLAVGSIPRKHPAPASTPVQTVAPTPTPARVNPPQIILPPPPTPEPEPTPEITPEPSPDTTHVPETAAPENLPG